MTNPRDAKGRFVSKRRARYNAGRGFGRRYLMVGDQRYSDSREYLKLEQFRLGAGLGPKGPPGRALRSELISLARAVHAGRVSEREAKVRLLDRYRIGAMTSGRYVPDMLAPRDEVDREAVAALMERGYTRREASAAMEDHHYARNAARNWSPGRSMAYRRRNPSTRNNPPRDARGRFVKRRRR